ncbi:MAG: hypothetical protein A2W90_17335 [Bacteroidetes bacterium GWF2_42_66]|nr:MAG: hypothetical protein A2W92_21430 [Bacteroidetes bacterium GWA2_42_15]OFX97661.1 MAG: hypothetical protein A2W89_19470 [Bacteroidetes bacterium GWE2_42_39]OFY46909.1 MAG: hypothetical protein A2W90_17335 [Bacteroidetes bacterium GWF2_42_66]HBL75731.1 hypothetical protein [Prolixibacteraceae bacterium]HCR92039.1 hypothetical protein [Prolixibacteraceae bacterium]
MTQDCIKNGKDYHTRATLPKKFTKPGIGFLPVIRNLGGQYLSVGEDWKYQQQVTQAKGCGI